MYQLMRSISLHVLDIQGNVVQNIFDSCTAELCQDIAENIVITTSRNGSTELSFDLLSADGTDAYESRYYEWLKPEYQIRATTDKEVMYFLLTNNSVSHSSKNKKTTIKAPGIQCLLKYKGLDLVFADDEGNNVGTANQLITAILKDTEWTYDDIRSAKFYEKYNTTQEKYRSLVASVKTGCFSLISKTAELFEAGVHYDSETKQVYLLPINPFSINKTTGLPDMQYAEDLYELNYGNNVKSAQRAYDSSNIATALYAYGAYGDATTGYCSIEELPFYKYTYTTTGTEGVVSFVVKDCFDGTATKTIYCDISSAAAGDVLEFWTLDRTSMLYIWNATQKKAYKTIEQTTATSISPSEEKIEKRLYNFLLDFSYYNSVDDGLSDAQLQAIAEYQINGFKNIQEQYVLNEQYMSDLTVLNSTINTTKYCKLNITSITTDTDNNFVINLGDPEYIWHAEVDVKPEKRFKWRESTGLDNQKDSINSDASVVYLIKEDGTNLNWFKVFIKTITKVDDKPTALTLYLSTSDATLAKVSGSFGYLFSANTIQGTLGVCESGIESSKLAIIDNCKVATVGHPVYYDYIQATAHTIPDNIEWCYRIVYTDPTELGGNNSDLYCCNKLLYNDAGWNKAIRTQSEPSTSTYKYWYNPDNGQLYVAVSGGWEIVYDKYRKYSSNKKYYEQFYEHTIAVFAHKDSLDYNYNGEPKEFEYTHSTASALPDGNYYFIDGYNNHILFTTDYELSTGEKLTYDTTKKTMTSTEYGLDKVVSALFLSEALVQKYTDDEMNATSWSAGSFDNNGGIQDKDGWIKTGSIKVRESTPYQMSNPDGLTGSLFCYTEGGEFIEKTDFTGTITKTTPATCGTIKITVNSTVSGASGIALTRTNYSGYIVYGDKEYKKLIFNQKTGTAIIGAVQMMKQFYTYADTTYGVDVPAIEAKQAEFDALKKTMQESLGSIYRESYWNPTNYVDGDEQKLLADAVENLDELCKPTATYTIDFIDLYGAEESADINCLAAIHIVDDEIPINCYGYIDTVNKCYDKPWLTKLTINTKLTKMAQSTFQDVLSNIAQVADETKTNAEVYSRSAAINSDGTMSAETLEGMLAAQIVSIDGGAASWSTDEKGNIVIVAADGQSAVKITGAGILVANTRDEFGKWLFSTAISGAGINADVISTGKLNAALIEAGTITADKLSSNVGESLEISANESLLLYATATDAPFQRSAGSLLTKDDGVSYIDINKDYIKINANGNLVATGSTVDIIGGNVNVKSDANVSIEGGSDVSVNAGSQVNVVGGEINVSSNGELNVDAGSVNISAGSSLTAADANGNTFKLDSNGTTISGQTVKLLTNSGTDGKIVLGSDANYITSQGILSLHNEDLVLSGVDGSLTTKGALNVAAGGNINLTTDTSSINMTAGNINLTGGALTANGGAVDIKATSTLDIASPNFNVVSSTGEVSVAGRIVASEGLIGATNSGGTWTGGWTIASNKLYSGNDTTYVELNSNPSSNYAILVGGENEPTQENAANFAVRRNGTTIINKLQRYTDDTHTALETIDLRKSLWQLNYGVKAFEKTDKADGSIDLTIKRTGMPDLTVNFTSAGGIKNYRFDKVSDIPTGGITFNVSGINSYGNVIPNTTHGPYNLTSTARYITVGDNQYIRSSGSITFTSPTTTSITGTYDNPFSLSTTVDTAATGAGLVITPIANLNYQMITGKTPVNANLTMSESISDDTLTVISEVATDTAASSTMKDYTTGGNILKYLSKLQITRKIISDETEKLSITTEHDVTAAATYTAGTNTITISPIAKISGGTTGDLEYKGSNITGTVSLETEVASGVRNHSAKFTIGTYTIYGSLVASYDPHTSKSVTPISGSGYSSTGNNKYLCSGYLTVPSTTYPAAVDPYSSSEVTPIGTSYTLTTNNIIGAARYTHKCSQVYVCGTKSYTVFNQTDPESGTTYHCVNASEGTVLYQQSSTTYYGSTSQCYTVNSTSSGASATYYLKGGSVKYTSTSAPDTLYAAGTAAQYIQYDGTLYTKTATEYARINASYAGEVIGTGVNTTKGWYANVGGDKTVYDAGTAAQYIQYDGTLYEPHDI